MYQGELKRYLDDLASRKAAPGGGSAAALTASTGVSLISMVANFTLGKEKYKSVEDEIKAVLSSSESLRERLLNLVDQDVAAYRKISGAYKLPKDSAGDKRKQEEAIQVGLREALAPPFKVCKLCHQAIKLCPVLAEKGNVNLISDVGVAVNFLESAFQSALLNVEINLKYIKDQEFIVEVRKILKPMEEEVAAINQEVEKRTWKHIRK